ncbi:hypothetical protein H4I96_08476 [Botrytis cinerea]
MKLLLSIPLIVSALAIEAAAGGDAVVNQVHDEARAISNGGLDLPGTSLVTINNVVVASTLASAFGDSSVLATIEASAATSSLSDNFPPVSPGHTNIHSSSYESTTVVVSTITVTPQQSVDITPVTQTSTSPSAIDNQGAALVSPADSGATITSDPSPAASDITHPLVLETSSLEPDTPSSAVAAVPLASTFQSSAAQSSIVESTSDQQYTFASLPTESSAAPSSTILSLPTQSLTIKPTPFQSSAAQKIIRKQHKSSFGCSKSSNTSSASSLSTPVASAIVGTPPGNSAKIPTITPPYNNVSSTVMSAIVGTPLSVSFNNSSSTPASDNIGTTSTSATSTTTITSTTTRTGTITKTITKSSADVTSQSIIGKFPDTDGPSSVARTTETFTSGGRTWTTTETGPPSTVTASLMLNPSYFASSNGGVVASNGVAPSSGVCTCPSQVTVTVTATPFVVSGGTLTATGTIVASSANSPDESNAQASWSTHSVPGFIGVTIPSGGMSFPPKESATYSFSTAPTNSPSLSHTHPYMSIEPTPNLSAFSNHSTASTGSLLSTGVGTGVGAVITPSYAPTTKSSVGLPPAATVTPAIYSGNADVNVVGTESIALIVGFVALVLLV